MKETVLEGVLGKKDEGEGRPLESPKPGAAAESLIAGIVAVTALQDPQVARDASILLQKHSQLLAVQLQQLEAGHRGWPRRVQAWTALVGRIGMAFLVVLVFGTVLVLACEATVSRGVVIDALESPPALATQGVSGKVLASGLLDVLTHIQASTRSSAEGRNLSNAWTDEIAIEIPETGISIAEVERLLKSRLGHEQHIGGDLIQESDGRLVLTVRGTGILPRTFTAAAGDLDGLLKQAGEYVYSQSQPGLWAAYLSNNSRSDETIKFVQDVYAGASPQDKPYLLNYLANALIDRGDKGAMHDALDLYREALRMKPDFWIGYTNVMNALYALGDEEGVVHEGKALMKLAGGRPGRAPADTFENYDSAVRDMGAVLAHEAADVTTHGSLGTLTGTSGSASLNLVQTYAELHDVVSASLVLKTATIDDKSPPDVAVAEEVRAQLAEEAGDYRTAAAHWDLFSKAYASPAVALHNPSDMCLAALSYEKTGQPMKADAALAAVGSLHFVDCERYRGDVLDLRGDWTGAQAAYAQAVKLAPSIPAGYYSWGLALAKHGELDAALVKLRQASEKGPHWGDPLKAQGDVLAQRQQWPDARARYDEALKYAPRWAELRQARDVAARH